jgi:hypothetical protein
LTDLPPVMPPVIRQTSDVARELVKLPPLVS